MEYIDGNEKWRSSAQKNKENEIEYYAKREKYVTTVDDENTNKSRSHFDGEMCAR